ncbi:MAG TPA: long-chain fatty acid--CoA ligase [Solirubrobacteraceae bacterium]|jgi:long-chain acyl-CoA synthetase
MSIASDLSSPRTEPHDGAQTLGSMILAAARRGSSVAMSFPADGQTVFLSYAELGVIAGEIARGLIALGVRSGEHVAILCSTRAEWALTDYGCLCAGTVVVPIYHTNSPEECAYVLGHSESKVVFCEDAAQAAKVAQVRGELKQLEHVVVIDGEAPDAITLLELRRRGRDIPRERVYARVDEVDPDDVATLVYTSGTTGPPKGCLLTHASVLFTVRAYAERLQLDDSHSLYQFLPLAHVLARVAQFVILEVGAQVTFWGGEPKLIVQELALAEPTHFPAVPRIYEKIHATVIGRVEDGSALQRMLFKRALTQARAVRRRREQGGSPGPIELARHWLADILVLSKVRALFGPRLRVALVGAAPVAGELLEFFDACGVKVLEGYGLTESCAAATLNTPSELRLGSVGRPLPGTEVRIASDGEILLRGPNIFTGYYKNPGATREAIDADGWLATGDLGMITDEGYLLVTGRKKDLIITSSGKNITPVNIENALRDTRWISEAVVYGDRRPYLVALVTLDRDEQVKLAERLGIMPTMDVIAHDERVHATLQQDLDSVNARLARIEQIKRFAVLDHELSQDTGELTSTLKVKRAVVYERYAEVFDGLYREQTAGAR